MLRIDVRNNGNEYYIKIYQKDDFNEEQFLEEHEDDYDELESDNADMLMWLEDIQVYAYLNYLSILNFQFLQNCVIFSIT